MVEYLYPSLENANTALGPHHTEPSMRGVKCTPRKGNLGSGTYKENIHLSKRNTVQLLTGYIFPLTRLDLFFFSTRYSPLKGTIFGSDLHPDSCATLSECNPQHVIT